MYKIFYLYMLSELLKVTSFIQNETPFFLDFIFHFEINFLKNIKKLYIETIFFYIIWNKFFISLIL